MKPAIDRCAGKLTPLLGTPSQNLAFRWSACRFAYALVHKPSAEELLCPWRIECDCQQPGRRHIQLIRAVSRCAVLRLAVTGCRKRAYLDQQTVSDFCAGLSKKDMGLLATEEQVS